MLLNIIMAVSENILELQKEVEELVCFRSDEIGKEPIRIGRKSRHFYSLSSFGVILRQLSEDLYALEAYAINSSETYERSKELSRGTYAELLVYVSGITNYQKYEDGTEWIEYGYSERLSEDLDEYVFKADVDFYFMESDWEEHKYLLEE